MMFNYGVIPLIVQSGIEMSKRANERKKRVIATQKDTEYETPLTSQSTENRKAFIKAYFDMLDERYEEVGK